MDPNNDDGKWKVRQAVEQREENSKAGGMRIVIGGEETAALDT